MDAVTGQTTYWRRGKCPFAVSETTILSHRASWEFRWSDGDALGRRSRGSVTTGCWLSPSGVGQTPQNCKNQAIMGHGDMWATSRICFEWRESKTYNVEFTD